MPYRQSAAPPPPLQISSPVQVQIRTYRVITPLLGGGVEPRFHDPLTLIRPSAIRGQLRFWWRALYGGHVSGTNDSERADALRAAESAIWGSVGAAGGPQPSRVRLAVRVTADGQKYRAMRQVAGQPDQEVAVGHPYSPLSYGAFPLAPTPNAFVLEGVRFELELEIPAGLLAQVEGALWAWETFGGVGARTRRGFGAIERTSVRDAARNPITVYSTLLTGSPERVENQLRAAIDQLRGNGAAVMNYPTDLTRFPATATMLLRTTTSEADAVKAWTSLLNTLRNFRQVRPQGVVTQRNNRPHPGRNAWPEQEFVRVLRDMRAMYHPRQPGALRKVPRAAFGLPLNIQYLAPDVQQGDPDGVNAIVPPAADRFPSPLLLRPLRVGSHYVGLALVLDPRVPVELELRHDTGSHPVTAAITAGEARALQRINSNGQSDPLFAVPHNLPGSATVDLLQIFLDTLREPEV